MKCHYCGAENCKEAYDQLAFYTLRLGSGQAQQYFIHQLIVDAYGAQHLDEHSKPIGAAFTIIGLYLFSEKNYTGKQVQLAHMQLGKEKHKWPKFMFPANRGTITVVDVLAAKEGIERDEMIKKWAKAAWEAFSENRPTIINLLKELQYEN